MTKPAFLNKVADILELEPGELKGDESLEDIGWDSLSALSFIVMADEEFGVSLSGAQLRGTSIVSDLAGLLGGQIED